MSRPREYSARLLALLVAGLCPSRGLVAQDPRPDEQPAPIRLSPLPALVDYSRPAEQVPILTAVIASGTVRDAWLAPSPGRDPRVALAPIADSPRASYGVDLLADDVQSVLREAGLRGAFAVYARLDDGEIVSSAPIRYTFFAEQQGAPAVVVHLGDRFLACHAIAGAKHWAEPSSVTRLEYYFGRDENIGPVRVAVADREWAMSVDADRRCGSLLVPASLREAWEAEGSLQIRAADHTVTLLVPPSTLDLPEEPTQITIEEGKSMDVPGSRGSVVISVRNDTLKGHVLLEVRTADGHVLVPQRPIEKGDGIRFFARPIEKGADPNDYEEYSLKLARLVAKTPWQNLACFTLAKAEPSERMRRLFDDEAWPASFGPEMKLFVAQGEEVAEREWSVARVRMIDVRTEHWTYWDADRPGPGFLELLRPDDQYAEARILETYSVGTLRRGSVLEKLPDYALLPGLAGIGRRRLYHGRKKPVIQKDGVYWVVIGPPVSHRLAGMILGLGDQFDIVFAESARADSR